LVKKTLRANPGANSRPPPKQSNADGDGNQIHNEVLLSLPAGECQMLFSKLEFVRLNHFQVLHEVGDTIRSVYFCNSGMISTLGRDRYGTLIPGIPNRARRASAT
jgi:hypothetical protein